MNRTFLVYTNNTLQYSGYTFLLASGKNKKDAQVSIIDTKTGNVVPVASCILSEERAILHSSQLDMLINAFENGIFNKPQEKKVKKNPIEVIRYIRPLDSNCNNQSNLYGVTLIFTLDYEKRLIDVKLSVCNGDNFDKALGVKIARQGDIGVYGIQMPSDIYSCTSKYSLVEWFIERFPCEKQLTKMVVNINKPTSKLINQIYAASILH